MSTVSVRALVGLIQERSLLEAGPLAELPRLASRCADAARLLQELQRRHWLTPYQTNLLASGQADGLVLGPYVLLELLGHGAMGQVYRARKSEGNRQVALKVIPPEVMRKQRVLRRFQREAHITAQLAHPNIVAAYDAGEAGQCGYLAMEYVDGVDLLRLVKGNGPLPSPLACDLTAPGGPGPAARPRPRDFPPRHQAVQPDGGAQSGPPAADQAPGLRPVRVHNDTEGETRLTQIGGMVGTVDYMAPEQAVDARRADARSDVFSLGATLFYILTGAPPYPGNDVVEKITHRVQGDARRLSAHRDHLPAGLEAVVAAMLARDPARRPASARAAAAALAPFCRVEAVRPPPPPALPVRVPAAPPPLPVQVISSDSRRARPQKQVSLQALLIAAGVAIALILGVGALVVGLMADAPENPSPPRKPTPASGKGRPPVRREER